MEFEPLADPVGPLPHAAVRTRPEDRLTALGEVILCSDIPTQFALGLLFNALGVSATHADGSLSLSYVATLSLLDSVLLVTMMWAFLRMRGDRPRDVFIGPNPVAGEIRAGLPLIFIAFLVAAVVILAVRALLPWMHNVETNPLQGLLQRPADIAVFAIVAVVAGGVREELQRAFLMNRFERWLGGPVVGIVVASAAFGVGHILQGWDAAMATAVLGAFWATIYVRRRSAIAPVVSHSGFNLLQLVQLVILRSAST
jgi:membrane protease YdiL (CAAX protease family)